MEWNNWVILILALVGFYMAVKDWAGNMVQGTFPEHKDPPEESE